VKAVVQRVSRAEVRVEGQTVARIGTGLLVLVGVARDDSPADVRWMADKLVHVRIFDDAEGKLNHSVSDVGGALLLVSQFTLLGDCRKGRRPSFVAAAPAAQATALYDQLIEEIRTLGVPVETGRFGAMMQVELVNEGPVTVILDSRACTAAEDTTNSGTTAS